MSYCKDLDENVKFPSTIDDNSSQLTPEHLRQEWTFNEVLTTVLKENTVISTLKPTKCTIFRVY
jgi:hypothetical protein